MGAAAAETAVMGVAAAAAAAATAATATVACGSTQGTLQSARARAGIGWGSSLQLHLSSLELVATRRKYPPAELPETGNPTGSQEHTHRDAVMPLELQRVVPNCRTALQPMQQGVASGSPLRYRCCDEQSELHAHRHGVTRQRLHSCTGKPDAHLRALKRWE